MDSHEKMMRREMDIGTVMAAKGIVFRRLYDSMTEHGKEAPETVALKEELHKYTEILQGVRFGNRKAIRQARPSVRKFVDENGNAFVYEDGETKIIPKRELLHGQSKPDQFRPG